MRKRNLKKTILAAALAVPVAFSYPGWAVRAQEDEKVSTETEAQEVMQDNTAPEEAECEENPAHDEMDGAETDSTETDSTEADRNVSEEEKFFQSGLIANEDGEFLSSLEEMETSGEDSMFFQDGLEVLEDGSTDDLIDAYVAPENYAQEGTPVREGKGGFTAVANGNATITAAALDGSGKYAECSVVVEIPKENNQIIELAGGESKKIGITKSSFPEIIDFSKVTFDCKNAGITYEIGGFDYISTRAAVSIKALRKGNSVITASYENRVIARWTINVTSDWAEYIGYVNWRKQVESQIWTNGMSIKEKCDAAKNYIKTNFVYSTKTAAAVYAYNTCKGIDCFTATEFMGDFAKDANTKVQYGSTYTGKFYDYITAASSDGGHTFTRILINNEWVIYDANPPHV